MEIPEEMQKQINANGDKIRLLVRELEILKIEADQLTAIAREIKELTDSIYLEDEDKFGKWSIYWYRRCENYFNQSSSVMLDFEAKVDELNELTGGLMDWQRKQGAETDNEVLNAAILYLKNDKSS